MAGHDQRRTPAHPLPLPGACTSGVPEILPPASSVTRREALETGRAYTSMVWRGSSRNVRHKVDEDGIRIDSSTPGPYAGT